MSGKIEVIVEKGTPAVFPNGKQKRPDIKYYPYWKWKITGEDGIETKLGFTALDH